LRDRAAKDLVDELESSAARQAFEYAGSFGELAAASCLFLVTSDNFGSALKFRGKRPWEDEARLQHRTGVSICSQRLRREFVPSRKAGTHLFGFAIKPQRQILLEHLVKRLGEFVFVAARLGRYGKGDCGPGK